MTTEELLIRLDEAASMGLDGSPGDELCARAAAKIRLMQMDCRRLVYLFELQEESDNGRVFHPNTIESCRCMDAKEIEEILGRMKNS